MAPTPQNHAYSFLFLYVVRQAKYVGPLNWILCFSSHRAACFTNSLATKCNELTSYYLNSTRSLRLFTKYSTRQKQQDPTMRLPYLFSISVSVASAFSKGLFTQEVKCFASLDCQSSLLFPSRLSCIHWILVTAAAQTIRGILGSRTFATILASGRRASPKPFPFSVSYPTTTALVARLQETFSNGGLAKTVTMSTHHTMDSSSIPLGTLFWEI